MSWDSFYSSFKKVVESAADKINQTADLATLQVKLSMAERKLDEAYATLGRAAYRHFANEDNIANAVAACMKGVESAQKEVDDLQKQIDALKAKDSAEQGPTQETDGKTSDSTQ